MVAGSSVSCPVCSQQFFPHNTDGVRCEDCTWCGECESLIAPSAQQVPFQLCSDACTQARNAREAAYDEAEALRKKMAPVFAAYKAAARRKLFERDGWRCHLCGDPVPKDAVWPALDSAVLDHVIPRAKGGRATAENLRTAHASCNNQRKDMDLDLFLAKLSGVTV